MRRWLVVVLAGLVVSAGCTRRAVGVELPNLAIPVGCASSIVLVGCDARVTPPKCKSARVTYRKGCERILVGRQ